MTPSPLKNYESSKVHLETGEKSTSQETSNIVVPTDKCDDPSFFSGLSKSNTPDRVQTALGDEEESEKESSNIQLNKLSDNGKEPQLSQATETVVFTKPNLPSYVGNGQSKRSSGETPFSYMTLASSKRSGALDSETFLNQSNKLLQSSQAFYFGSERAVTRATFHPSDATSSSYPRNTFSFESETHAPVLGNKKISCAYDKAFRNRSTSESRNEHVAAPILPTISQTNNGAKSSFNAGFTFTSPSFSFGSQTSKHKAPKCETLKPSDFSIGGGKALRNEKKSEKSPFVISLQKSNSDASKTPPQDMKNKNNKLDSIISDSQHKEKSLKDLPTQPSLTLAFQPAKRSWECDRCLVRNAPQSNVCVACQSPKPGTQPAVTTSGFNFSAGTSPDFTFGLSHTNKASSVGTGSYFNPSNVNKHLSQRSGLRYCSSDTSKDSNKASGFSFGQPLRQTDESKAPGYGTSFTFGSQGGRKDSLKGPSLSCVPSDESKDTNNKAGLRFRKVESTKIAGSEFSPSNVNKSRIVPNIPKLNAYCSKPTMQPAITNYGSSLNSGTSSVLSFRTSHRNNARIAESGFNFSPTNVSIDPNQKSGVSFGASSSTKAVVNAKNLTLASKPRQDNSSKIATGGDDLKLKFKTYEGARDCDVCIVRNDKQNNSCVARQTSKPGTKQTKFLNSDTFAFGQSFPKQGSFAFTPSAATQSNVPPSGGFTFGKPLSEGFTLGSSSKDNQQSGFSFGAPGSSVSTLLPKDTETLNLIFGDSRGKEGTTPVFAFRLDDSSNVFSSGPVASGQSGFKFGDRQTNQSAFRFGGDMPYEFGKPIDDTTGGNLSLENKKPSERCTKENEDVFKDVPKVKDSTNILSQGTFTFRLDIPKQLTMTSPGNKENPEIEDEGVVFKPIVSLPSQVDVKTGEEGETTLFSSHAKLYRFTKNSWKERGEGEIKVLYDPTRQRGRVIMRRDQVHVLCANHFITKDMELKPQGSSGKSWLWHVQGDFAENEAKEQLFAVKFGDTKTALAFKFAFEECVDHNVVEDEVIVLSEVSVTEEQRARSTKFLLPPNVYAYENQNEIAPEEKQDHDKT